MKLGLMLLAIAASLLPLPSIAQSAPFCAVGSTGTRNCFYYNADSCQVAARSLGGFCTSNPEYGQSNTLISPQINPRPIQQSQPCKGFQFGSGVCSNPMDAFNEAQGRKREAQEHEARMELLRAQTQAARAGGVNSGRPSTLPIYLCRVPDRLYYSDSNEGGCVFMGELPTPAVLPQIRTP